MLCPRDDFYEKSPTQRHVDLASSSTRCTSPSCDMNFGCEGLSVAWWNVSRSRLMHHGGHIAIHDARDRGNKNQVKK